MGEPRPTRWDSGAPTPPAPRTIVEADTRTARPAAGAAGARAEAFGFRGEVWTARRVTEVIRREFGVQYHFNHVGNLLRAAGWSPQKPLRRASQRNEAAIERGGPSAGRL